MLQLSGYEHSLIYVKQTFRIILLCNSENRLIISIIRFIINGESAAKNPRLTFIYPRFLLQVTGHFSRLIEKNPNIGRG